MNKAIKTIQAKQVSSMFAATCTGTAITLSVGAFLADFLPHTFLIEKYKNGLKMLKFGEEVPLNKDVEKLFNTMLDDLELENEEKKKFQPFTVGGFEVYHAGIPSGKFYSVIGIPINFTYKDKYSIDTTNVRIGLDRESLNIYHPAAENLLDSLVLSDKAKKFAIAREVLMAQKNVPIYRAIESPVILIGSICLAEFARIKMQLSRKPIPLTVFVYGLSGIMGIMAWFQLRDATTTFFEKSVDKELAELGKDYIEGGQEYYDSILKRNIALRTLLGSYGTKVYKTDGDEIISLRQKKTPITYRKKFFSEYTLTDNVQQAA